MREHIEIIIAVALGIPACLLLVAIVASLRAMDDGHRVERD